MLRVAHVTTVHHPADPRITRKQLATLRAAGFDARLVAVPPPEAPAARTVAGIPLTPLPPAAGRLARWRSLPTAFRRARALGAALYHLHDPELLPVGYALKRATGARVVYDMHEDYGARGGVEGRAIRALERWSFGWLDHVVVANAPHVPVVAPAGVPVTRLANYALPPPAAPPSRRAPGHPLRLVYTGVMAAQGGRGLMELLRLARACRGAGLDVRLDLVGVCYLAADRARAEAYLARHALGDVVHRTGWADYVPHDAMRPFYAAADVGVVLGTPSKNHIEKIPTKFYEYLHHGLPILCTAFPVWAAFVARHGCGVAVPPRDAAAAAHALRQWRTDPARYARHAAAARAAASRFAWPVMARRLVRLYRHLLGA